MMSGDVLCSPASRTWLDSAEPSARSSLLASRLPRHPHSPRTVLKWPGPLAAASPRKDAPAATWKMSSCSGPMENHKLPLHGVALQT